MDLSPSCSTQHADSQRFDKLLSPSIAFLCVADVVRFPVEFDAQQQLGTVEVELESADSVLAAKFATEQFPSLENRPQYRFRRRHAAASGLPPAFVVGLVEVLGHGGSTSGSIRDRRALIRGVQFDCLVVNFAVQWKRVYSATRPPLPPLPKGGRNGGPLRGPFNPV